MLKKFEFEQALEESLEKLQEIIEQQEGLKIEWWKISATESITEQQRLNEAFKSFPKN